MGEQNNLEKLTSLKAEMLENNTAYNRLKYLFDSPFVPLNSLVNKEEQPVELVCGYGMVSGTPVYAFSQHGAIGSLFVEKMKKLYKLALKNGLPIIGIYDSNGLHLSEGNKALNSFGELLYYQNQLSGVVPQIGVVLGSCIGVNAMLACSSDFLIMSQKGEFMSTPKSEVEEVSSAKSAAQGGIAHITAEDNREALDAAKKIMTMFPVNNLAALPVSQFDANSGSPQILLQASQDVKNLDIREVISALVDANSQIELLTEFGTGAYTGLATIKGNPVAVSATVGGQLSGDDCSKIARLVSVADSFSIPIITIVNSMGTMPMGAAAAKDMAKLSHVYAQATSAKIALIAGNAIGASYVALASPATNSDLVFAWQSGVISPLKVETAVAFLEGGRITKDKSRQQVEEQYIQEKASPIVAAQQGIIDDVISPENTREILAASIKMLASKRQETLPKKHGNIPF